MRRFDVIVIGGGAMGAAATWALSRRGRRVSLLERFEPGHARGSSHGATRAFRLGYAEADYIALARRAIPLWRALEGDTGATLLELTGVIDHGRADAVAPIVDAFRDNDVRHDVMDAGAAARRWPGMRFEVAVVHHADGGRVYAQRAVDILYQLSRQHGADIRFGVPVEGIDAREDRVTVRLAGGERLHADRAVVTVGAWAATLLGGSIPLPRLQVSAEQPMVFRARTRDPASWIPFIHRGGQIMYGLGAPGDGVKVAEHHRDEWLDPDDRPFDVDASAQERLSTYIARWLPGLDPQPISATRCLYTTTPSHDFILDRRGPVVVGAGFSGHGFKFTPVVGEILADLAEDASQTTQRFTIGAALRGASAQPR